MWRLYLDRRVIGRGDRKSGCVRIEVAGQNPLHGAGRLRKLARRGGYGTVARPAAGYAYLDNKAAAAALEKHWGGKVPSKPGLTAPQMIEAAQAGKLSALYVVGANPLAHYGTLGFGRGKVQLLIVHEMFLTETSLQADIVFPAASAYEKDGSVTNTSGEIQLLHKAGEVMGTRTDFDLLRIMSHQLEKAGTGQSVALQDAGGGVRRNSQSCARIQRAARRTFDGRRGSPRRSSSRRTATRLTMFPFN